MECDESTRPWSAGHCDGHSNGQFMVILMASLLSNRHSAASPVCVLYAVYGLELVAQMHVVFVSFEQNLTKFSSFGTNKY